MSEINPTLEKTYNPKEIEQTWYKIWEQRNYFAPTNVGESAANSYCIILPPPNVTGNLHMGHGFGFTLNDILIRYSRMCGKNTLWQGGTDHAGIATQMVVERQLHAQNTSRLELGREAFEKKIWEWKEESGGNITRQLRRLGASLDWTKEKFTLDPEISKAVREVFIQLYDEGLIYRGTRLVNWDPSMLTAISDLEVISEEVDGQLWYINYPLSSNTGFLTVATTRPETLLGDTAVAVHPNDERYKHLIGKELSLPLTDRKIPIIADEYVDPTFGTGCVKITPAHDFNDYEMGLRHGLTPINILTPTAHLNKNVPVAYQNLERFAARKKVLADLENLNLITKIEKHKLKIPRGEKSGVIIEPMLTQQWFMKMQPLAEPAIAAVESGEIKFVPENWSKTYFQWMHNIQDWCISRQLWWGHRIPVWYDTNGSVYVGQDEEDVRKKYKISANEILTQENDVLDTWFSAALWPFSTLGWPKQTELYEQFFPTQVLITGFDIIFFWVARMIMMSLKFTKKIPFSEVYITGLIRDADGKKMSKSKGNVLDPIDLIDGISLQELLKKRTYGLMQPAMAKKIETVTCKEFPNGIESYGTDALRFTFCSLASYTREIRFDLNRLGGYRNFCNKLWNASRYVMMNTEGHEIDNINNKIELSLADHWILGRLQLVITEVHHAIKNYRFDLLAQTLYDFTWNEFCDWYLELSKPTLLSTASNPEILRGTRHTLLSVLETILRMLHPIMPFITEDIWQKVTPILQPNKIANTIMLEPYPQAAAELVNHKSIAQLEWIKSIIIAIRTIRSEMNVSPKKQLAILFKKGTTNDREIYAANSLLLMTLAKLESITWLAEDQLVPESASAFLGELEIYIPLAGLINKDEEKMRLQKEISKCEKDFLVIDAKLNTPTFVEKAPAVVVEKERLKRNDLYSTLKKLQEQLQKLNNI